MTTTVVPVPAALAFASFKLILARRTNVLRAMFTGKRQYVSYAYAIWSVDSTLITLDGQDAADVRSFLSQLDGQANTFRLPIPGAATPNSGYTGNGLVNGALQQGTSIVTDGWTPSTLILKNGDYFNIGDELKMATADVTSNSSGQATISFKPQIRNQPADNSAIQLQNPYALLSASDDNQAAWQLTAPVLHSVKLQAIEAF